MHCCSSRIPMFKISFPPHSTNMAIMKKSFVRKLKTCNFSEKQVLPIIVYVALFLDYMMMTAIVPILPAYLEGLRETPNDTSLILVFNSSLLNSNFTLKNSSIKTVESSDSHVEMEHYYQDNIQASILLGSKAVVQIAANPFIGCLTNKIGYTIPLFFGFIVILVSTLAFAFASSYAGFLAARAIQGLGSACCSTAGLGMLASKYTDPTERGVALSFALGGLALGILAGYPFGGLMYDWAGKSSPFFVFAFIALVDGTLQLIFLPPKFVKQTAEGSSFFKLLRDPYILLAATSLLISATNMAVLESASPLWMKETMNTTPSVNGLTFVPVTALYMVAVHVTGPFGHKIGRWLLSAIGLGLLGISMVTIPAATTVYELIAPNVVLGIGVGIFDSTIFPEMSSLIDLRHAAVYGSVYAIADIAVCLSYVIGPLTTGPLIRSTGFSTTMRIIGGIAILYAPLLLMLKNPPARETKEVDERTETKVKSLEMQSIKSALPVPSIDNKVSSLQLSELPQKPSTHVMERRIH